MPDSRRLWDGCDEETRRYVEEQTSYIVEGRYLDSVFAGRSGLVFVELCCHEDRRLARISQRDLEAGLRDADGSELPTARPVVDVIDFRSFRVMTDSDSVARIADCVLSLVRSALMR